MQLDVDLPKQSATNDLPDQAQDQVLADLNDIATANVHDGAADTFRGFNDNIVVFRHVEGVQGLDLLAGAVEDTLIDRVRNAVVDQLGKYQAVFTLVEHLKGIGREGQHAANVRVAGEDSIDVPREFGSLVLVDSVRSI